MVPVSGKVLIDGKPLTHGYVRFAPDGSRPSMGRLDENGNFRLTCYEPGDGAVVGRHRVAIMSHEPVGSGNQIKWHAPKRYENYATSGLTEEVTEPTDSLVINLTWGKDSPGR